MGTIHTLAIASVTLISGGATAEDIQLYYSERPPYYSARNGEVHGLLADVAATALKSAGIPFVWVEMPPTRQFELLKRKQAYSCIVGAYITPERVAYARFTRPIYQNRPTIALGRANDARLAKIEGVEALLRDPNLVLLVKKSYSYGAFLDDLIAKLNPRIYMTTVESDTMFRQIGGSRADYMFMAAEEGEYAMTTPEGAELFTYTVPGMPGGSVRYLMCSVAVPESIIERIDASLP